MENYIADRMGKIEASGIRKAFALAATVKDPIDFSIGQPDFDVPDVLKEGAISAIRAGANKYSQTAGDGELKQRIAARIQQEFGWDKPRVIVTCGVSGGLLLSFLTLVNPGDEVIIPDPYFVIYKHVVNLLGGKCVFADSYPHFDLPIEKIADCVTDRTKMIIINSPCNPTGAVYSHERMKALAYLAARKNIIILADEIYEAFCYDGDCPSIASYYDKTILLRGFGKAYAMTGWRLGYAAVNACLGEAADAMTTVQQYTFVCAPTPLQKAAAAAFDCDVSALIRPYKKKRDLVYEGLRGRFEMTRPAGAFYAFIKAPGGSAAAFVEKAIKNKVLVIPGGVFSEKDTHFRISYATSDDTILRGVDILNRLV
ncbi:MAG TPA: aminotransferase class I/II-fold pyridoxal phosphate-dependent enzyme [Sedimentisphaerales bacterium]|nr:aminotransferase class I/II-fold pyridoxal phosphate-dependent enzyme [Sedimentisphaerales bacterium]